MTDFLTVLLVLWQAYPTLFVVVVLSFVVPLLALSVGGIANDLEQERWMRRRLAK